MTEDQEITDVEAERRVLSAVLHSDVACVEVFDSLTESDFSDPFTRSVFLLSSTLFSTGTKPTLAEIMKESHTSGWLKGAGDIDQLRHISESYIDEGNIKYWIEKAREASKGRAMQKLLKRYTNDLENKPEDIMDLIREASGDMFSLAMEADTERIITGKELGEYGKELLKERVKKYREMQEQCKQLGEMPLEGLPTGLPTLNRMTLGYKPGDLIILAAETGKGKTAFAINTANSICIDSQENLLYINTEMSKKQIAQRWGAILSGFPLIQVRGGSLRDDQMSQAFAAYDVLSKSGFITAPMPNLTPRKADIITRKAKMQFKIKMMILDYIGRMDVHDPKMQDWQVLYDIIKSQKQLAQNLEIACMVLVQLNPDGTLEGAKKMKNECDLMLKLLPVPDEEAMNKIMKKMGKMYEPFNYRIFVDKARDSESGVSIPLVFDLEKQQIREAQCLGTVVSE